MVILNLASGTLPSLAPAGGVGSAGGLPATPIAKATQAYRSRSCDASVVRGRAAAPVSRAPVVKKA